MSHDIASRLSFGKQPQGNNVLELLSGLCRTIDQNFTMLEEDAEPGDWYLAWYTQEEYDTYVIMERVTDDQNIADDTGCQFAEDGEDIQISSDLTLEEWVVAIQFGNLIRVRYNTNMQ